MDLGLKDKVAIVTGSARGIGAATARRLAQEGVKVVINDIQRERAEQTAAQLVKLLPRLLGLRLFRVPPRLPLPPLFQVSPPFRQLRQLPLLWTLPNRRRQPADARGGVGWRVWYSFTPTDIDNS